MEELKVAGETTQYIVIKLGQEQYGIDIRHIDNIVRLQHTTRVPKMKDYIKGVINLRGEVIPIMSIRLKMGLDADVETSNSRIIIVKLEQYGTIGMIVDAVNEVVTLDTETQVEKMSYDKDETNYILGVGKYEGGLISLLDLNAVLLEK